MTYGLSDIQVLNDPLAFIRANPRMFLPQVNGLELALNLVRGIHILSKAPVTLTSVSDWWLVATEEDWLTLPDSPSLHELFSRILPFPQAGRNAMRPEATIAVLAEAVATWAGQHWHAIKNELAVEEELRQVIASHPQWKRVVAFRMP